MTRGTDHGTAWSVPTKFVRSVPLEATRATTSHVLFGSILNTRTHQQQIINILAILTTPGFNLFITKSYHQLNSLDNWSGTFQKVLSCYALEEISSKSCYFWFQEIIYYNSISF
jgi:hypothetical protein